MICTVCRHQDRREIDERIRTRGEGMICTVCRHQDRREIDEQLATGATSAGVAARYGLSATAIKRHRGGHLPARLTQAAAAADLAEAGALLGRVARLVDDLDALAAGARRSGDGDAFLRAVRELRPTLELLGKVTGQLQTSSVNVSVTAQLGVPLHEARSAVALVRKVAAMTDDERAADAAAWLRARGYIVALPERPVM